MFRFVTYVLYLHSIDIGPKVEGRGDHHVASTVLYPRTWCSEEERIYLFKEEGVSKNKKYK